MHPQQPDLSSIDAAVAWCLRHWLLLANCLVLAYGGLPIISALLLAWGYTLAGELIFRFYGLLCHQRPERSFFVLGQQVAICHREVAMYAATLFGGLIYAPIRLRLRPLPARVLLLLLIPMLLDGGIHVIDDALMLGIRPGGDQIGSVNWWLRMTTGLLFAVAVVLGIYPRFDRDLGGQQI